MPESFLSSNESIVLKIPSLQHGMDVFNLVARCPPLDANSSYCNLLQCSHFSETSVAAYMGDEMVGFVSAYRIPDHPHILFIWQVAVAERARGRGLASRMVGHILERPQCASVTYLETSITQSNAASWAFFKRLAQRLRADLNSTSWMEKDVHFDGQHDSEKRVCLGPFRLNQH